MPLKLSNVCFLIKTIADPAPLALRGKNHFSKWIGQAVIVCCPQATPLVQVTPQLEVPAVCKQRRHARAAAGVTDHEASPLGRSLTHPGR